MPLDDECQDVADTHMDAGQVLRWPRPPGVLEISQRQSNSCLGPVLLVSLQASSRCQILFKCSWPELCLEVGKEESLVVMLSLEDWQGEPIFLASCCQ